MKRSNDTFFFVQHDSLPHLNLRISDSVECTRCCDIGSTDADMDLDDCGDCDLVGEVELMYNSHWRCNMAPNDRYSLLGDSYCPKPRTYDVAGHYSVAFPCCALDWNTTLLAFEARREVEKSAQPDQSVPVRPVLRDFKG